MTWSVRHSGVWKAATPYVKQAGVWKAARPSVRQGGVWKAVQTQSLSFVGSAVANAASISMPGGAQAGDLCVCFQWSAVARTPAPALVTPSGFTAAAETSGTNTTIYGGRSAISYKVLAGGETTITGMSDGAANRKALLVFRPGAPISGVAVGSLNQQTTTGDPSAQTLSTSGLLVPGIALGHRGGSTIGAPTGTLTTSGTLVNNSSQVVAYEIQNAALASRTFDAADAGNLTTLQSLFLLVS